MKRVIAVLILLAAAGGAVWLRPGFTSLPLTELERRHATPDSKFADVSGVRMHYMDQGSGDAVVLMARDLQGNASATPVPIKIHWQNGLRFDGQTIAFDQDVVVASADSTLKCERLLARLAAPIQFGQAIRRAPSPTRSARRSSGVSR